MLVVSLVGYKHHVSTMRELVYRYYCKWDKPAVTLPGAESWNLLDRHVINNGFCADRLGRAADVLLGRF